MSGYIGVQPVPRASRVLTEGTLSSDTQFIDVPGGFTPNNIAVYINGTRLRQTEYDDSDGSQIDLLEVFSSGTEYVVEEFRSFEIPNHFTKAESDDRYAQQTDVLNAVSEAVDYPEAISMMGEGAIVESGSNDDGSYERWESGLQLCFTDDYGSDIAIDDGSEDVHQSAYLEWNYPANFLDDKKGPLTGSGKHGGDDRRIWVTSIGSSADFYDDVAHFQILSSRSTTVSGIRIQQWGFYK